MQFDINYTINASVFTNLVEAAEARIRSNTSHSAEAVQRAGDYIKNVWIRTAQSRFKKSTGGYTNQVANGDYYPYPDNPLYLLIEVKGKVAILLEEGYDAYDMKKMFETSPKVKVSKQGRRYLIIPFQHGTSEKGEERNTLQTMPDNIYKKAKRLTPTTKVNRSNPTTGEPFIKTKWGTSLKGSDVGTQGQRTKIYSFGNTTNPEYSNKFTGSYTWKSSPYKGMYRVKTNKGSVYITFRAMVEGSPGWIHPRQPALKIAHDTYEMTKPGVIHILSEGVREDIKEVTGGAIT